MASRASSLHLRTTSDGGTAASLGNLWEVWCLIAGITSTLLGLYWDISWHMSIGRDTFWTPAHVAIYVGAILGGLGAAAAILPTTFARGPAAETYRQASVQVWGFRGPLGAFVCAWGGIAMLSSAPFDNWWHSAYGLDVKILSPPHVLLLTGILAVEFGTLLMILQLRVHRLGGPLDWLLFYAGGVILSNVMIALEEFSWRSSMHSARPYWVFSAAVPLILLAVGDGSRRKWGCTAVAGMFTLGRLAQLWILPLFAAQPKLGPVYQKVTHFVPMSFPWLLIAPAIVLDLVRARWTGSSRQWVHAASGGIAFVVTLLAVQWPFAAFLMSSAARNRFFGAEYFAFANSFQNAGDKYRFFPLEDSLAEFWTGMVLALLLAVLSVRAGMALGAMLGRLRR
jgi:hypothetical protein